MTTRLEHVNLSVRDARATSAVLQGLFDWTVRWEGETEKGYSVHLGGDDFYLALYTPNYAVPGEARKYGQWGGMNHIGVTVDDLGAAERRVTQAGYKITLHGDYEPGRRFYFDGPDGVEYEVVSYA